MYVRSGKNFTGSASAFRIRLHIFSDNSLYVVLEFFIASRMEDGGRIIGHEHSFRGRLIVVLKGGICCMCQDQQKRTSGGTKYNISVSLL